MASVDFTLQESARNLARNRGTFFLATIVQAICLLLFSIFLLITLNLFKAVTIAQKRIEVYAFLDDRADKQKLIENIKLLRGVADVRYVSKEEALVELRDDLGESAGLVDVLETNPLPASLRIQLESGSKTLNNLNKIEEKISVMPGVREVWSGKEILQRLDKILRLVVGLDIALLIIISLSIIFISFQTIEATILLRSREIEIMRLVGATERTVRGPFQIEGVAQGLIGGIIASILVSVFYYFLQGQLPLPNFPYLVVFGVNILFGCLLGLIGSELALNKTKVR
ncbi:MAG: permease-like cell division protein FtsX [candidate division WOR-3 bacterium]